MKAALSPTVSASIVKYGINRLHEISAFTARTNHRRPHRAFNRPALRCAPLRRAAGQRRSDPDSSTYSRW